MSTARRSDRGFVLTVPSLGRLARAELSSWAARRALAAEFVGTLLFVFFAAGTVATTAGLLGERLSSARLLLMALAHGLAFGLLVAATLRISGGHLNPAITLGAVCARRIGATKGVFYLAAQTLGAVAGALLLKLVVPATAQGGLGAHALGPKVTVGGAVVTELVLAFVLVSAFLVATADPSRLAPLAPVVVGAAAMLGHLFGGPITGASMNPARSFGPALVAGAWNQHWIFWVGPLLGAAAAGLLSRLAWSSLAKVSGDGRSMASRVTSH